MAIEKNNATVPYNIQKIIDERGLKQGVVARWAGLSKQQLNDMLRGRRVIKPCDIMAISNALGVSIAKLFSIDDET